MGLFYFRGMEILKLLFHHDLILDADDAAADPITQFSKPQSTYSAFRISCSNISEHTKGLEVFSRLEEFQKEISDVLSIPVQEVSSSKTKCTIVRKNGEISHHSGLPKDYQHIDRLRNYLGEGTLAFWWRGSDKEEGKDFFLISTRNRYAMLFYLLKGFMGKTTRFYSLNGKRIHADRVFYFEDHYRQLPHGIEEVLPSTEI